MKPILTIAFCLLVFSNAHADIARKFDEYTDLPFSDEKARLDNWGIQLKMEQPDMIGWYLIFAGSKSCPGEARRRAIRAKNYLVKKRGIPADRVIWVDEGYREELTVELWIWPRRYGKREPTNSPTVNKNEVQNCKPKGFIPRRVRAARLS